MKMPPISVPLLAVLCLTASQASAQDVFMANRAAWLQKAEQNKPQLTETVKKPVAIVSLQKDEQAFQGWKAIPSGPMEPLYLNSFKKQSGVIVDFGGHLTGYFSFTLKALQRTPDAPLRFKFTFGEVPAEVAMPFDPYHGTLSRAWLQDEVVTVTTIPATITIPRRLAFRYVKIELLGASPFFDFAISGMECRAVTSAAQAVADLAPSTPEAFRDIDRVGLATLKDCMQTVYEDGPKRDQRLWIGDFRLQALANNTSFKSHQLTRRCLYLFAGLSDADGYLPSNVFEAPEPHAQANAHMIDYALLYIPTLKEYFEATQDRETALDLWPVAKRQLEIARTYIQPNGLFNAAAASGFFDWNFALHKQASIQGLTIMVMKDALELASLLGKTDDVAYLPDLIRQMEQAARDSLLDKDTGLVISGPKRQVSYSSQIWMILGGVLNATEGQRALKALASTDGVITPTTPYLHHYLVEAMIRCGMLSEARDLMLSYWGGMVRKGADTFWEVYNPKDDFVSPFYKFYPINSYCHAWSCTPVYFIRKHPELFQK